mmetsp:Transcript_33043/g.97498  ORF Transcript_33043/g.97498 Transcript_33043/m.97498 type:complete len:235 (-) Transcript_33043:553-1257(-)
MASSSAFSMASSSALTSAGSPSFFSSSELRLPPPQFSAAERCPSPAPSKAMPSCCSLFWRNRLSASRIGTPEGKRGTMPQSVTSSHSSTITFLRVNGRTIFWAWLAFLHSLPSRCFFRSFFSFSRRALGYVFFFGLGVTPLEVAGSLGSSPPPATASAPSPFLLLRVSPSAASPSLLSSPSSFPSLPALSSSALGGRSPFFLNSSRRSSSRNSASSWAIRRRMTLISLPPPPFL